MRANKRKWLRGASKAWWNFWGGVELCMVVVELFELLLCF